MASRPRPPVALAAALAAAALAASTLTVALAAAVAASAVAVAALLSVLAAAVLAAAALAAAVAAALAGNGVYLSTCVVTIIDTLWLCAYLISIFCANDNVHGQRREHDTTTMTGI